MAPSVPPSLKKIKVFLARAEELDRDKNNPESRVVAYNCRQYAVLTGIPLAGATDNAAKTCLSELLGQLEKEKGAMSVFSKQEHWKICRKVADKVFDRADSEDRGGVANKGTAKSFYAAGTFYEILQQFYEEGEGSSDEDKEMKEEEEQRRLYCKWKATEILNAIKEGRTPTPGGYQQQEDEDATGGNEVSGTDEFGLPLVGSPTSSDIGGGLSSIREASTEDVLPPAPPMPTSDVYSNNTGVTHTNTQSKTGGVELNLDGEPTVEEVNEGDEDSGTEDIFIPDAAKKAADNIAGNSNTVFVDDPQPTSPPPPPYSDFATASTPAIPPPAASKPLPPPPVAAPSPSSTSSMFSKLSPFGKASSSTSTKLSKAQMADAVELTKFALAALQKGDGDLGRERLEQALGIWRR